MHPRAASACLACLPLLQVLWQQGLIVTFSTLCGALLLWFAVGYGIQYYRTGSIHPAQDFSASCSWLAAAWRRCWRRCCCCCGVRGSGQASVSANSVHSEKSVGKATEADSEDLARRESALATAFHMMQGGGCCGGLGGKRLHAAAGGGAGGWRLRRGGAAAASAGSNPTPVVVLPPTPLLQCRLLRAARATRSGATPPPAGRITWTRWMMRRS